MYKKEKKSKPIAFQKMGLKNQSPTQDTKRHLNTAVPNIPQAIQYTIVDTGQLVGRTRGSSDTVGGGGGGRGGFSLGFLIIEFHSESVVQLPKSSPLYADVGVIREIKDCGAIKYPWKRGTRTPLDTPLSAPLALTNAETGLTSG